MDEIIDVNERSILAAYTFKENEFFFTGHFPGNPVVPGAILQEAAAQIGLLAFGMHLLGNGIDTLVDIPVEIPEELGALKIADFESMAGGFNHIFYLTSTKMDYKYIVRPKDRIYVYAEKVFFRLNKLKCNVRIENESKVLISKGVLSGIVINSK